MHSTNQGIQELLAAAKLDETEANLSENPSENPNLYNSFYRGLGNYDDISTCQSEAPKEIPVLNVAPIVEDQNIRNTYSDAAGLYIDYGQVVLQLAEAPIANCIILGIIGWDTGFVCRADSCIGAVLI
jgi:hypothetical protein